MIYGTNVTYCFAFRGQAMEKTGTSGSVAAKSEKKTHCNASQLAAVVLLEVELLSFP